MFRIGQSTDIHRFKEGNFVIIGGEKIEASFGVVAHSDGDALVHAISEAILGALGLRDLGYYFPDNTDEYKDANSLDILSEVIKMMENENYIISNIDSLVIIESVKLMPHIENIKSNLASVMKIDERQISVKATRGEKLGFVGNNEGYVAQAIVLLEKKK